MKFFFLIFLSLNIWSKEVPPLTGPVMDLANLLSQKDQLQLRTLLYKIAENKGPQLQFLSVVSLDDESLEGYSIKVTDRWMLGDKKRDDGLLLLVALKERQMRIEVGQGLEGIITDFKASQIIRRMKPYFKNTDYASGIYNAFSEIAQEIGKDPSAFQQNIKKNRKFPFNLIIYLIFFIILFLTPRGRNYGYFGGGHSGRGGWSGGRSGRGGWSGGGGGFSGGGSSGGW